VTGLILASNSPRRRELLALTQREFIVSVADVDESQRANESPAHYVIRLAETKARAVITDADRIVLAADTAVVAGRDILGKPKHEADAFAMLARLRGQTHQVYTGIALLRQSDGFLLTDLCITDVPMRRYSDDEIHEYIASGDPFDKAGAYAIQHKEFHPVESMHGCYASVMGLPLCHMTRLIRKFSEDANADISSNCQKHLQYDCPVYGKILKGEM
jgi:MAF protein